MTEHEIMTIEEVAQYLRVSEKTVYDWAQRGIIPCGKLGNSWRFKRSEVERWVNQKLRSGSSHTDVPPVSLTDVLTRDQVRIMETTKKTEALQVLIDCLSHAPQVTDGEALAKAVFQREKLMSTGIGLGVAVPHVRLPSVTDIVMSAGVSRYDIEDYDSLDGQPVRLIFLTAAGQNQHGKYLRLLSDISRRFRDEPIRQRLLEAKDADEFYRILTEAQ